MHRRESISSSRKRSSRRLSPPYLRRGKSPSNPSTRRTKSPYHLLKRSRSPSRYSNRSKPSTDYHKSDSPYFSRENTSLTHYLERSRSPPYDLERHKSPSHFLRSLERSRSPPYELEWQKSPSHFLRRSRSPILFRGGESPSHYTRGREISPYNSLKGESPHQYLRRSESPNFYLERRRSQSPSPELNVGSPPHYIDKGDSSPCEFLATREHIHNSNEENQHSISWSTSHNLQFTSGLNDSDARNTSQINQYSPHSLEVNRPQETPVGDYIPAFRSNRLKRKVTSLEEIDRMTTDELKAIRISGASKKKMQVLMSQGIPYMQAKCTVIRGNFIREWNNQRGQQCQMASTSQQVSLPICQSSEKSYTQVANENVTSDIDGLNQIDEHASYSPIRDIPDDIEYKRSVSEISAAPGSQKHPNEEEEPLKDVMIVQDGYPETRMTFIQLQSAQNAIMLALEDLTGYGSQIRFKRCNFGPGYLLVTCADKPSADWLEKTVPKIKPWNGAVLRMFTGNISRASVKCTVFVSDENGGRLSAQRILNRLEVSNKGLNTYLWRIVANHAAKQGQLWVFIIDDESLDILKKLNMRPYFGFGSLKFKLKGNQAKKTQI